MESEYHGRFFLKILEATLVTGLGTWVCILAYSIFSLYFNLHETFDYMLKW